MTRSASALRGGASILALLVLCAVVLTLVSPRRRTSAIEPAFEFMPRGYLVVDIQFSPDGRQIAVVTLETDHHSAPRYAARVYRVPQGTLVREIASGAWKCAWTRNGSILALPRLDAMAVDLWDTRNWTIRQTLPVTYPKSLKTTPDVLRLCFDQHANLYIAEFEYGFEDCGFATTLEYSPRVWWNLGDHWKPEAELFGFCSHPSPYSDSIAPRDMSVSSAGKETRVAFTSWNCWAQILKVRESAPGKRNVEVEYSMQIGGWIKLTPDGQQLVLFHPQRGSNDSQKSPDARTDSEGGRTQLSELRVFRLYGDHVKTIGSRTVTPQPPTWSSAHQLLDVSDDGRFAAVCTQRWVEVVRLPSCERIGSIPNGLFSVRVIAFSPDGNLLAVADEKRKVLGFYRIPHEADY
jgi:dipeptidyl aminopeptidase/acylaminoacyl peptidase